MLALLKRIGGFVLRALGLHTQSEFDAVYKICFVLYLAHLDLKQQFEKTPDSDDETMRVAEATGNQTLVRQLEEMRATQKALREANPYLCEEMFVRLMWEAAGPYFGERFFAELEETFGPPKISKE